MNNNKDESKQVIKKFDLTIKFKNLEFLFDEKDYEKSKVKELITLEDIKILIKQFTDISTKSKKEKLKLDNGSLPEWSYYFRLIIISLICMYFVLMLVGYLFNFNIVIIIAFILMVTGVSFSMIFSLYNLNRTLKPNKTLLEIIKKNLNFVLNKKNYEYSHLLELQFVDTIEESFIGFKILS